MNGKILNSFFRGSEAELVGLLDLDWCYAGQRGKLIFAACGDLFYNIPAICGEQKLEKNLVFFS